MNWAAIAYVEPESQLHESGLSPTALAALARCLKEILQSEVGRQCEKNDFQTFRFSHWRRSLENDAAGTWRRKDAQALRCGSCMG